MHSWVLHIEPRGSDLVQFRSPGKVRCVQLELVYHGFTVCTLEDYYSLLAQHTVDHSMTWFLLKYADSFHIQLIDFDRPVR